MENDFKYETLEEVSECELNPQGEINARVLRLLENVSILCEKVVPIEKLKEWDEYEKQLEDNKYNANEKFLINEIIVIQQEKYYRDYPIPGAFTRLAKKVLAMGNYEEAIRLYEIAAKFEHNSLIQNIAKNALCRHFNAQNERKVIDNIKTFDDAITTAISFRRTRKVEYNLVLRIVNIAEQLAVSTQDMLRVAVEYKRLKQTQKAKEILNKIRNSELVRGNINDVVYAATLRKEAEFEEAEILYRAILNKEPVNAYAKIGLAAVLKDQGLYSEAYKLCNEVLDKHQSLAAIKVLASIISKTDNIDLACKIFKTIEKKYPVFNPYKYLDILIEKYSAKKDIDGVKRINVIKEVLAEMYNIG